MFPLNCWAAVALLFHSQTHRKSPTVSRWRCILIEYDAIWQLNQSSAVWICKKEEPHLFTKIDLLLFKPKSSQWEDSNLRAMSGTISLQSIILQRSATALRDKKKRKSKYFIKNEPMHDTKVTWVSKVGVCAFWSEGCKGGRAGDC